jgi:hypothetical protein
LRKLLAVDDLRDQDGWRPLAVFPHVREAARSVDPNLPLGEVRTLDPLTFIAVPTILASVALLACVIPAGRAARLNPIVALRDE